jgi:hypothetical protein
VYVEAITMDRDAISDRVRSVSDLYSRCSIKWRDPYRQEGVAHSNLVNTLEHSSFRSQDLLFELVDEQGNFQNNESFLTDGRTGLAGYLEYVIDYDESPDYNVVYGETSEGLVLHARTLSTYETRLGHDEDQEEYYVGLVNVPMGEAVNDTGTDNLADISAEDVEILLSGGDPTPSLRESMRRSFDTLKEVAQLLRK